MLSSSPWMHRSIVIRRVELSWLQILEAIEAGLHEDLHNLPPFSVCIFINIIEITFLMFNGLNACHICILLYYLVVFHLLEKLRKILDIFSILSRFKKWFQDTFFDVEGPKAPRRRKMCREITFWTKIKCENGQIFRNFFSTSVWKRSK